MNINELKSKTPQQLLKMAEDMGIENPSQLNVQQLRFAVMRVYASDSDVVLIGDGVLEKLPDGFGFLRAPESNYLAGPDDLYVSPSLIKKYGLKTGDYVEGRIQAPQNDSERYFALETIERVNGDNPEKLRHRISFDDMTPLYPDEMLRMEVPTDTDKGRNLTARVIDFSNDGYKRTNRKKASNNLQDVDHAHERYAEVVELVRFGRKKMQYLNEEDFYEGHIDPTKGDDWNQSAPVDTRPTLQDFKRTVANYLSWEVSQILKQQDMEDELSQLDARLQNIKWGTYKISNLFDSSNGDFDIQKCHINGKGDWVITAGLTNNGVLGRTDINAKVFDANTITIDMFGSAFYRQFPYKMVTHARVFSLKPRFYMTSRQGIFIANTMSYLYHHFGYENMCSWEKIKDCHINLPLNHNGGIDFDFMEDFIRELERNRLRELERNRLRELEAYLQATGIKDYDITPEEEKVLQLLIKR